MLDRGGLPTHPAMPLPAATYSGGDVWLSYGSYTYGLVLEQFGTGVSEDKDLIHEKKN